MWSRTQCSPTDGFAERSDSVLARGAARLSGGNTSVKCGVSGRPMELHAIHWGTSSQGWMFTQLEMTSVGSCNVLRQCVRRVGSEDLEPGKIVSICRSTTSPDETPTLHPASETWAAPWPALWAAASSTLPEEATLRQWNVTMEHEPAMNSPEGWERFYNGGQISTSGAVFGKHWLSTEGNL